MSHESKEDKTESPPGSLHVINEYNVLLAELKDKILSARVKTAQAVYLGKIHQT